MGSIGSIRNCIPFMFLLAAANDPALAQDRTTEVQSPSVASPANERRQDHWRDGLLLDEASHTSARSGLTDWGTGGFRLQGEKVKSGSKLPAFGSIEPQWRRTYDADAALWQAAGHGLVIGAGAHVSHTNSGTSGGPLLTRTTISSTRSAYFGVQVGDSTSIKVIAFDDGGWSRSGASEMVDRIANGERIARKGVATEFGRFFLGPRVSETGPEFNFRLERARTAFANSDTAASFSLKLRF